MIDKKQERESVKDVCVDMLSGAATALTYTDEEIRGTLPPEEAQEFIDLRDRVFAKLEIDKREYGISSDECDDLPMAAEDEAPYGE